MQNELIKLLSEKYPEKTIEEIEKIGNEFVFALSCLSRGIGVFLQTINSITFKNVLQQYIYKQETNNSRRRRHLPALKKRGLYDR